MSSMESPIEANPEQALLPDSSITKLDKPRKRFSRRVSPFWRFFNSGVISLIVIVIGLIWSVPTFGLLISSFRPVAAIHDSGWWTAFQWPWEFTIQNYQSVINSEGMGKAFMNSIIIAVPGTIIPIILGAIATYAFCWLPLPGRNWIFLVVIGLMVIPIQITLAPILSVFTSTHLVGNYVTVWLAHTAFGLPFTMYLLRNFFSTLPEELIESAHMDGASHWRIFWSIVLPLSVPALASLFIFQFMWVWNDLLVSMVLLNTNTAPMTVKVANLVNSFGGNYEVLTSAAFITMILPLAVFFAMQRYFVRGIMAGSVKG